MVDFGSFGCTLYCFCNTQNILVYSGAEFTFTVSRITDPLSLAGYSYKLIVDVPLTSNDFIGIDVLFDATFCILDF